tara:strand:+ start:142 stop:612 length:471 start_codon:yes stop_codon:yes gene_type:complete
MIKYLFIILGISIIIYLARNKLIEPLGPLLMRDIPSPVESNPTNDTHAMYLTDNHIDYELLDNNINNLTQQYNILDYNIKNFKMKVGGVATRSLVPGEEKSLKIEGNYPSNIKLDFVIPPPLPGPAGPKGDKGSNGRKGHKGSIGDRGIIGGNNYC